jgi:PAS domain-containing protein
MLQWFTARLRITAGLAGLMMLVYLATTINGLYPNEDEALQSRRAAVCENVAVNTSLLIQIGAWGALQSTIAMSANRSEDLLSIGVRNQQGRLVASSPGHLETWGEGPTAETGDKIVRYQVPVFANGKEWGDLEFCLVPAADANRPLLGALFYRLRFPLFLFSASFLVFFVYLGMMLTQLDPRKTVPSRVKAALDNLTEGLLVLDVKGRIVLANEAFLEKVGVDISRLLAHARRSSSRAISLASCRRGGYRGCRSVSDSRHTRWRKMRAQGELLSRAGTEQPEERRVGQPGGCNGIGGE